MLKLESKGKQKGFSLIELMIVVAIIGILLSIAYPSYQQHIMKSKRVEAMNELMHVAQLQEKYFSQNLKYAYNFKSLYGDSTIGSTTKTENDLYNISINTVDNSGSACTATSSCIGFTLTATASSSKSQSKDKRCNVFTIANTGAKSAKDSAAIDTTNHCW